MNFSVTCVCTTLLSGRTSQPTLLKHGFSSCVKLKELKRFVLRPNTHLQWMPKQLPQRLS